jgi:tight adherence protein C
VSAVLAVAAVGLAFAAGWQLFDAVGERLTSALRQGAAMASRGRVRSMAEAALLLGIARRLEEAGLATRISPAAVLVAKGAGIGAGALCAALAAPALPARLGLIVVPVLVAAGFLAPDALLERAARRRRAGLVAALPDALDLLAVGAATGRSPTAAIGEISADTGGPLAAELAVTVADVECGTPPREAIAALRERVPGAEVGALAAALERSRRYGSPLADQLHEQASALRRDARRRVEERAARAAPKIQLVVALVLVPSVLLLILAAILAHSDALFGAF